MAISSAADAFRSARFDPAPIIFFAGVILTFMGGGMLVPAAVDLAAGNQDYKVFLACAGITSFSGACMAASTYRIGARMRSREVLLAVPTTWIFVDAFASLPFMFSELRLSLTDAVFETMSGLTATGSTVIVGLDSAPPGILMWRFQVVWFGGFGMVTLALLILPFLRIGGMQMFSLDLSAQAGRFVPRITTVISRIALVYLGITVLCAATYRALGMTPFDAVGHAMSTVATGGFSSHDASFGFFQSAAIEYAASGFMLLSALPFYLLVHAARGQVRELTGDSQVRLFIAIVVTSIAVLIVWLATARGLSFAESVRGATFNIATLITCTGFTSQDFSQWGGFALILLLTMMLMGGCTGSTAGGIKMFRIYILFESLRGQLKRQVYPNATITIRYNKEPVPDVVRNGVTSYFFVFMATFFVLALLLAAAGLSFEESFSASATALSGVGPGFGPVIGPCCTFEPISDVAKWLLTFGMFTGRLEILIVILPLTRTFWRA